MKQRASNSSLATWGLTQVVKVLACALTLIGGAKAAQPANTLPTGGQVVAGQASINQGGNSLNIQQTSQRAVINWNTYNVGADATVNYQQPNSQAVLLNRVVSATSSQIDGAIKANGRIIIANTNGVTFGKGADVQAAAVVATTMNQTDQEFMEGSNTFSGAASGKVVNKGKLQVTDASGYVALLAPDVRNQGVISATVSNQNAVVLGAGEKVTLQFTGTQLIGVTIDKAALNAAIKNRHAIEVAGGTIVMAAGTANQFIRSVVKNTGTLSASSMVSNGGTIELVADTVVNKGTIAANAEGASGQGGKVHLTANTIQLDSASDIQANSATQGNGGTISVVSQVQTTVAGKLSATGGSVSGNGGTIETSSKGKVSFASNLVVNTSAPRGSFGQWIVDPQELTIDANAARLISQALNTTHVTLNATTDNCVGAFGTCTPSASPVVNFLAGADIMSTNSATSLRVIATGGIANLNSNIDAGQVYIEAATINVSGNINTTGGANGKLVLLGAQINLLGNLGANGQGSGNGNGQSNGGGTTSTASTTSIGTNRRRDGLSSGLSADTSTYATDGGNILVLASGDIQIGANATLTANGLNGGSITVVSQGGTITQHGVTDAVGTQGNGGRITMAGQAGTALVGALMSVDGAAQGGVLQIGIAQNVGSGSTLAPPAQGPPLNYFGNAGFSVFSQITALDSHSQLSATGGVLGGNGGLVETSGQFLSLGGGRIDAAAVRGSPGTWLLDPNNVTISAGTTAGGTLPNFTAGQSASVINATDIQNAINAGTSVKVVADGTITQSVALTFAVTTTNRSPTLTVNNSSGSKQSITLAAITDNTTAAGSSVSLSVVSAGGGITLGAAISVKGTLSIDNTYGCTGVGCTPVSGFITAANVSTLATSLPLNFFYTTSAGGDININYVSFNATGPNQAAAGATTIGVYIAAPLSSTSGNINITGLNYASNAQVQGAVWFASTVTANNGTVTIVANEYGGTAGTWSVWMYPTNSAISAQKISITGYDSVSPYGMYFGQGGTTPLTIVSGHTFTASDPYSIYISQTFGNPSAAKTRGIQFLGNIVQNSNGGSISISANAKIESGGTIQIAANQSGTSSDVIFDTRLGPNTAFVTRSGTFGVAAGSTSPVNFSIKTNAAPITLNSAISVPGYIKLDMTDGGTISASAATANAGINLGANLTSQNIGNNAYGLTIRGLSTTVQPTLINANTLTNGAGAILITGDDSVAGGVNGISTNGPINQNANGGNITFKSNNIISQTGTVTVASNTSGQTQSIIYDTSTGNSAATITSGPLVFSGTGSTSPVNYSLLTAGAPITSKAVTVRGAITVDNTYGCAGAGCTPTSGFITLANASTYTSTSTKISITGALNAGTSLTLNGVGQQGLAGGGVVEIAGSLLSSQVASGGGLSVTANSIGAGYAVSFTASATVQSGTSSIVGGDINFAAYTNGAAGVFVAGGVVPTFTTYAANLNLGTSSSYLIGGSGSGFYATNSTVMNSYAVGASSAGIINVYGRAGAAGGNGVYLGLSSFGITANNDVNIVGTNNSVSPTVPIIYGTAGTVVINAGNFYASAKSATGAGYTGGATVLNLGLTSFTDTASNGNVSFIANGVITQTGTMTMTPPTATVGTVTYDTTSGTKLSSITSGTLTIGTGAAGTTHLIEKTAGASITANATSVTGTIALDNTYGGITPASGYLNYSTATSTNSTSSNAITLNGALVAGGVLSSSNTAITVNAVSSGAGTYAVLANAAGSMTANNGNISISGSQNATSSGGGALSLQAISAANGNIAIQGATTWGNGTFLNSNVLASAGNITISGASNTAALSGSNGIYNSGIISASQDVTLIGLTNTTNTNGAGIFTSGTGNALAGRDMTLSAYNAANVGLILDGVTYAGRNLYTYNAVQGSNVTGYAISDPTKGATTGQNGYAYGVWLKNPQTATTISVGPNQGAFTGTKVVGTANIWGSASNTSAPPSANYGVYISNSFTAGAINVTGSVSNTGSVGVFMNTGTLTSTTGAISITGTSLTGQAIALNGSLINSKNGVTLTGAATTATTVIGGSGAITNAAGDITVTGTDTAAGSNTGISLSGSITQNANGGNVKFISNNSINQSGTVTIAQNTSGQNSVIRYDTTTGNRTSIINGGAVTFSGTSTSLINYENLASGAQLIVNSALNVPGAIIFDNTYLNGVQGGITSSNAWSLGTVTAGGGIPITASLTAKGGIFIRGVVGASSSTAAQTTDAVSIYNATAGSTLSLTTTGAPYSGTNAIQIIGITPQFAAVSGTTAGNAIHIYGASATANVAINNNSVGGNTNIVAYTGRYNDVVSITNASSAGAIALSAIGTTSDIVTVAGTTFTQNSNAGIFIATSNNGNVTPPKIINNGTGPVAIAAGAYLPVGTVSTACAVNDCGQITALNTNTITSPSGGVYLYAGSPGIYASATAGQYTYTGTYNVTSNPSTLSNLLVASGSSSLSSLSFANTLFGQAYAAGNVAATNLPIAALSGINTTNVASGTGYSSWTTSATNGPVIQFRTQPTVQANVAGHIIKAYGTNDPLSTAGNIAVSGSLDYQLNSLFVKNTSVNPGYLAQGSGGCTSSSGCMNVVVNGLNFVLSLDGFINSIQANSATPRTSYGTLAGEQVNGTSSTAYTSSYGYNLTSTHGVLVSSGISINLAAPSTSVGLVITPAALTITASDQVTQTGVALSLGTTGYTATGLKSVVVDGVTLTDTLTGVTLKSNGVTTVPSTVATGVYAPGNANSINPSAAVFGAVSGSNGASNYAITYVSGTLTVTNSAIVTISMLDQTKVYGGNTAYAIAPNTGSFVYDSTGVLSLTGLNLGNGTSSACGCTISGLSVGATITGLTLTSQGGSASASVGAGSGIGGTYPITPSAAASGLSNVVWNYINGSLTVTPRPITISAVPVTTTYGTAKSVSQSLTSGYTVGGSGLGANDTLTNVAVNYYNGTSNSNTVPASTGANTYANAIVPSAATGTNGFNSTNYNITYAPANLVVNPLAITITANAQSTTYGTALALGTTAFTSSIPNASLPNGDTVDSVTLQYLASATVSATANAGSYPNGIVASNATGSGGFNASNYAITYAPATLTINKAPVTISPVTLSGSGQTVVYNGATQTFNASTGLNVTGMQNGEALVFGTSGLASNLNVGTYANNITVSGSSPTVTGVTNGGLLSNYNITVAAQGSLTITPAPLTVSGSTSSTTYNQSSQVNASPVISGLVGVDTQSGNGVNISGIGTGTNAGTYNDALVVSPKGATSLNNYTLTKTNGSLTIGQLNASIVGATTINTYNGALQTNPYTVTGVLAGDVVTVSGSASATHVAQGTVADSFAVGGSAAANYKFNYSPGSITLTPAPLTVTGTNTTQVYTANNQTNAAATINGLKGSDTAVIGGTYGVGKNVGSYSDQLSVSISNASDYTIGVTNGSISITPAVISISGISAYNKVYDATTAATLNVGTVTYTGVYAGDTVTVNASNLSGSFADKNVGTAKTVNISGIVLAGSSSANYQLSGGTTTTTTANITPAALSVTGASATTTYNGSVQALSAPTVTGVISGDNVVVSTTGGSGTNAGTYAASYTASGTDASNYLITSNAPTLTINKAALTVIANNSAIIYGQTDPTLTASIAGLQGSDTAAVINSAYSIARASGTNAGTYPITVSGPSSITNYNVTYAPAQFTIAPAGALLITLNPATTTYGTAAVPTVASVQGDSGGVIRTFTNSGGNTYTDGIGTTITITPGVSGATVTSNVGAYANATTGSYAGTTSNYTSVSTIPNVLTITPAPLTLTVANVSKTYDANAVSAAQITAGTLTSGVAGGVTVTSGALMNSETLSGLGGVVFTGSAIGAINASNATYPINGSVGSGFSNYAVSVVNGTLTVNRAPLTINGAVSNKVYNGGSQTNAVATTSGLKGSDVVSISGYGAGTHVGTYADNLVASGAATSNYDITYNNGSLTVTPAALTVIGAVNQYVYNGAAQTNTGASISGLKGTDTASISGYASATHVSQGVVADALVATISNSADYNVTYVQGSLQITPATLTATVNSGTTVYSGGLQTTGFVVNGLKGSDTATAASGTASGTNVGSYTSNLVLNVSSDYLVGSITNGTLTITPAPLTISGGLSANNKVYDATTAATISVSGNQTLAGVLGTDAVSVSSTGPYSGATFSQSNVGSGLTVTPATVTANGLTSLAGVTLTGAAAGNYYVAGVGPQTLTANITPRPITINSGLTANDKVYDGTVAATLAAGAQTLFGVLAADAGNVAVSSSGPYTGTWSQANVGTGLTVTPSTTPTTIAGGTYNAMSGVALSGTAAGNYYVTGATSPITGNITPYVINFGGGGSGPNITATANNKVYDTTTTANGSLALTNLFANDSVAISYASASFANPNVANGIAVTFATPSLSGAAAANYTIGATPITATANITPAPLTITALDKASFYSQSLASLTNAYTTVGLLGADTLASATVTTTATTTGANSAVGTYAINVSAATGSAMGNYAITYVPATYTIVGAGQLVVTTAGVTTPYGTGTSTLSGNLAVPDLPVATYSSGGANISGLTYVSSTPSGTVVHYTYKDATNALVTFDLSPNGTSTSSSGHVNVGSYPYAASNLVSASSGLTSSSAVATGNFTVTPLAITVTAPTTSLTYNGALQSQGAWTTAPAILTNDVVNISGLATGKNVGIYRSNLLANGADVGNYSITYVNNNLTISPYVLGWRI